MLDGEKSIAAEIKRASLIKGVLSELWNTCYLSRHYAVRKESEEIICWPCDLAIAISRHIFFCRY